MRRLKLEQPALSDAVDLHVALFEVHRRIQPRIPLPWIEANALWWKQEQAAGRPLVRFQDIPMEWTDFRLVFREVVAILQRFSALEAQDVKRLTDLARDGRALEAVVRGWYDASIARVSNAAGAHGASTAADAPASDAVLDQVLSLAIRPFLSRCADAVSAGFDCSAWSFGHCPLCGGEPELAVLSANGDRELLCGRCGGHWPHAHGCPFCNGDDVTSFSSPDRRYRLDACNTCRRYVKVCSSRDAARPVMAVVDAVATLPLDAAAMQQGYSN